MVSTTVEPFDGVVPVAVAAGNHHAVGAAVVGDQAVGSGQHGVERILKAQQAVAVPVDAADDVGRQRPAGILARIWRSAPTSGNLVMIASATAGSTARAR